MRKCLSLALVLCLIAAPAFATGIQSPAPTPIAVSQLSFGDFSAVNLHDPEGEPITSAIFQEADLTLVNFWATWCGPCLSELKALEQISVASEGRFQVLGITLDVQTKTGELDEHMLKVAQDLFAYLEITYPMVVPDAWLSMLTSLLSVVPTTFFVDREGNIIDLFYGANDLDTWMRYAEKAMPE